MGYAGYAPSQCAYGTTTQGPVEQALRGLPVAQADGALDLIEKLSRNVSRNPKEEKFRKVRLENKKIAESLTDVPGAVQAMLAMGWVSTTTDDGACIELPASVKLEHADVVKIIEARDFYTKERENEKRNVGRNMNAADSVQLENDRKEREAALKHAGPAYASVATKLGNGPQVVTARLAGLTDG